MEVDPTKVQLFYKKNLDAKFLKDTLYNLEFLILSFVSIEIIYTHVKKIFLLSGFKSFLNCNFRKFYSRFPIKKQCGFHLILYAGMIDYVIMNKFLL